MKCSFVSTFIFSMLVPMNLTYTTSEDTNPIIKQAAQQDQDFIIFKRTAPNPSSVSVGNKLLNNELYVNNIWPAYPFKGSLTWKENPYTDSSWCFYFHSLDMVGYLMNAYEKTPSQTYLKKAKWYIDSWMAANPSPQNQASLFAWDDHSTANRVTNIIYFWHYYQGSSIYDKVFAKKLMNLLQKHGDFLADDTNYTKGNNHGIFQDRSLIELALLFPDMKNSPYWYDKAMDRLLIHVKNDVTKSGIHKEHSPSYHSLVLTLFKDINHFITQYNIQEIELSKKISKMEEYVAYLAKPDGVLPIIGDSDPTDIYLLDQSTISNETLHYVLSKGAQGEKTKNNVFYPDGGIAIFRNGWNIQNPLYVIFTAAYHSNVHKHADDLSFLLTYGKTDFFVDSGKYSYNETEKYRKYFRSTLAHNTITVDNKSYSLTKEQVNKSRMDQYKTATNYSYVTGSHDLYTGVTINRTVIYLKKMDSVLIRDVIGSDKKHTYSETFNIGKDVQITSATNKTFILASTIENKKIEFKHLTKANKVTQYNGSVNPIAGWQSLAFNKKHPITQLQFSNNMKNMEFTFVINTDLKMGVQNYTVTNKATYDLYSIVYKDGKRESIKVFK